MTPDGLLTSQITVQQATPRTSVIIIPDIYLLVADTKCIL